MSPAPPGAEAFLDAFLATHPEAGPVVSQNVEAGTLSIVVGVDADNAYDAFERGRAGWEDEVREMEPVA